MTVADLIYQYTLPDNGGRRHLRVWGKGRMVLFAILTGSRFVKKEAWISSTTRIEIVEDTRVSAFLVHFHTQNCG